MQVEKEFDPLKQNSSSITIEKEIELISLGCTVETVWLGLLVNGKYIVAPYQRKWKILGKNRWYWYSTIPDLVKKYFHDTM